LYSIIGLILLSGLVFIGCDNGNTPETKMYTVTIGTLTNANGSTITADPTTGSEGTEISLTITSASNFQLKTGTLKYGTVAIDETTKKFNLPAENVTITAEFETIGVIGAKTLVLQGLPNNGNCIVMVSTASGANVNAFKDGVFAIGFVNVSDNEGTFLLKQGTAEEGPISPTEDYTETGFFYLSISYNGGPHFVTKDPVGITQLSTTLTYNEAQWASISLD
jgi:hypothetical protein